jgi:hypothetical protein
VQINPKVKPSLHNYGARCTPAQVNVDSTLQDLPNADVASIQISCYCLRSIEKLKIVEIEKFWNNTNLSK